MYGGGGVLSGRCVKRQMSLNDILRLDIIIHFHKCNILIWKPKINHKENYEISGVGTWKRWRDGDIRGLIS